MLASGILVFLVTACSPPGGRSAASAKTSNRPEGPTSSLQSFETRGIVREFRPGRQSAFIEHEAIPGFMEAMTMMFSVNDTNEFAGIAAGDEITFRMIVTEDDHWIENVRPTGEHFENMGLGKPSERYDAPPQLEPGDLVPDVTLTNQVSQTVHLHDYVGQAFAFTFFYTRCPVPDFCPRMSKNFSEVQKIMQAKQGIGENWHLFSISFDPKYDTPANLSIYAKVWSYDPRHWSFLTGDRKEIGKLGDPFGLNFRTQQDQTIEHNLRTVVVGTDLRVRRIITGNTWAPAEVADALVEALSVTDVAANSAAANANSAVSSTFSPGIHEISGSK